MNVVLLSEIAVITKNAQASGKTVIATNGCFDILHVGHLRYLQKSKAMGDLLVVGVNSDSSVKQLKGKDRPINSEDDRAELLAALEPVDYVVIFDELDASNFLREVKPDIYTKGGDYKPTKLPEYSTIVEELGAKIEIIDLVEGKSTTATVTKLTTNG
jgi:rfaE bifunctional protein nucleotidyltransferase chain/domain